VGREGDRQSEGVGVVVVPASGMIHERSTASPMPAPGGEEVVEEVP
jgi:hypothetical protein